MGCRLKPHRRDNGSRDGADGSNRFDHFLTKGNDAVSKTLNHFVEAVLKVVKSLVETLCTVTIRCRRGGLSSKNKFTSNSKLLRCQFENGEDVDGRMR
jgi:hypothetical protein